MSHLFNGHKMNIQVPPTLLLYGHRPFKVSGCRVPTRRVWFLIVTRYTKRMSVAHDRRTTRHSVGKTIYVAKRRCDHYIVSSART